MRRGRRRSPVSRPEDGAFAIRRRRALRRAVARAAARVHRRRISQRRGARSDGKRRPRAHDRAHAPARVRGARRARHRAQIDRLGGEIGFDVAASTITIARTGASAATSRRWSSLIVKLLATPTFPDDELARLLRETRAELHRGARQRSRARRSTFRRTLFAGSPVRAHVAAERSTLGAIDATTCCAHHARHYVRQNAVIALAGDVDRSRPPSASRASLTRALPSGRERSPDVLDDPKPLAGRHLVFVDKPERTQTQILIGSLGTSAHDPDHVAAHRRERRLRRHVHVASHARGARQARLVIRRVARASASIGGATRSRCGRSPPSTDAAACIALELELLAKLLQDGVTEREVKFMQKYLTRS